jgi:predicted nuclease of predicted toxin-antitoxin system
MKLLLDQGMPRGAVAHLRLLGYQIDHVAEIGLDQADDPLILEFARQNSLIVVTHDADFHALLALSNADAPSVIRFRVEGLKSAELATKLHGVVQLTSQDLSVGAVVTVLPGSIRVRHLPISVVIS